jgi:hypothetical protein
MQITTPEGRTAAQTAADVQQNALMTVTPAQGDAYIDANVTSNTAVILRAALKVMLRLLIFLRDRQTAILAEQQAIRKRLDKAGL